MWNIWLKFEAIQVWHIVERNFLDFKCESALSIVFSEWLSTKSFTLCKFKLALVSLLFKHHAFVNVNSMWILMHLTLAEFV